MTKVNGVITTTDYVEGECTLEESGGNGGVGQEVEEGSGTPIYFDVVNGVGCSNYHEDNSLTGYNGAESTKTTENQTSCLKFYAFLYGDGDTKVNLLLDHNTTAMVEWNSSWSSTTGPKTPEESTTELLGKLKTDTASWNGTITPADYTIYQEDTDGTIYGNYTIDYDNEDDTKDYKARLITAQEIAQITGADKKEGLMFDESTTSYSDGLFYFDTNSQTSSDTHKYGWLYDRTATDCTIYGCLNNSDDRTNGYWTSTFASEDSYGSAWSVHNEGKLTNYETIDSSHGVRPVIEVLKSNL